MKIVCLVENTSNNNFKTAHGLSFYIETLKHKLLFDLGPDDTLFKNAEKQGIDLRDVDTVIISHGHYDHGGALKKFLELNKNAKVFIQRKAFGNYYSRILFVNKYIGLDHSLMNDDHFVLLDGDYRIDDELFLFVSKSEDRFKSEANASLLNEDGPDDFKHEQNLLIDDKILFMGCGHSGVVNILENLEKKPKYCFGGFHIYNPALHKTVSLKQLSCLKEDLKAYQDVFFFTCHCTGIEAFNYLKSANIAYIACGDIIEL